MSKKIKEWKNIPIRDEIMLNLLNTENRGEMLTSDLYRKLKLIYPELTHPQMMSELFRLEVRGFIHVIPIKKTVYKIELSRNAKITDEIKKNVYEYMH